MAKKVHTKTEVNQTKKLVKELTERIKEERKNEVKTFEKVEGLYRVIRKYNGKKVSKYNFRQLTGLYKFIQNNPKLKEEEIRLLLHKRSSEFGFLIICDRNIDNFFSELKNIGAEKMALRIENNEDVRIEF